MDILSSKNHRIIDRPIRVMQIGEGNFLRAFSCYFIQKLNDNSNFNGNIAVIKPTNHGNLDKFKMQDNLYTVRLCGESGNNFTLIDSVSKVLNPYTDYSGFLNLAHLESLEFVISNTTEAGISYDENDTFRMCPQNSYPGKLTRFIYERFIYFKGKLGLIILPCELIDNNGTILREIVLRYAKEWNLSTDFIKYIKDKIVFSNTLVDRIVSGYPGNDFDEELGYEDKLLVSAEDFGLWVIENGESFKNILNDSHIVYTDDITKYKKRKVRILNGAHTSIVAMSLLLNKTYVNEALNDKVIYNYLSNTLFNEIIPSLENEVDNPIEYAEDVRSRFINPNINHRLIDISLNSTSKWITRCLPSVISYNKIYGTLPSNLVSSLAFLIYLHISRNDLNLRDDEDILIFFKDHKNDTSENIVKGYLKLAKIYDISNLYNDVLKYYKHIKEHGIMSLINYLEVANE